MCDIKNIAHLFLLKHSKISSHIFDDASYFFDDAKECCSNLSWNFYIFIVKDNGFDCGFWIWCLSYDIKNIAHLFSLKHSKISSHIFDDASYFFDDAKECYSNLSWSLSVFIVKDNGFDCGFWIWCLSYDFVICWADQQLSITFIMDLVRFDCGFWIWCSCDIIICKLVTLSLVSWPHR